MPVHTPRTGIEQSHVLRYLFQQKLMGGFRSLYLRLHIIHGFPVTLTAGYHAGKLLAAERLANAPVDLTGVGGSVPAAADVIAYHGAFRRFAAVGLLQHPHSRYVSEHIVNGAAGQFRHINRVVYTLAVQRSLVVKPAHESPQQSFTDVIAVNVPDEFRGKNVRNIGVMRLNNAAHQFISQFRVLGSKAVVKVFLIVCFAAVRFLRPASGTPVLPPLLRKFRRRGLSHVFYVFTVSADDSR